jgi:hypothetical protein
LLDHVQVDPTHIVKAHVPAAHRHCAPPHRQQRGAAPAWQPPWSVNRRARIECHLSPIGADRSSTGGVQRCDMEVRTSASSRQRIATRAAGDRVQRHGREPRITSNTPCQLNRPTSELNRLYRVNPPYCLPNMTKRCSDLRFIDACLEV